MALTVKIAKRDFLFRMRVLVLPDPHFFHVLMCLSAGAEFVSAGMITKCVEINGVGIKFTALMMMGSGGSLFVAILLAHLTSLALGSELSKSAAYLVVPILVVPAFVELSLPLLPAYLICVWFAVDSAVTHPVCVGSYVAGDVADAHPLKRDLLWGS